ncbi:M48 family metallopeptidase [Bacillus sp. KH172YL63]|uniref:M48 family metallopeptidase n=1 Tax=Bacillus sp. KH172YL63 TaxID=2709784 RepID=UPI0013E51D32|nr:SprT family zinc-dependent metalloprotease [Bacillus sp. KH172YL63]BCB03910.1 zinc metalloprotease [Bacillus sp. KH172YL63]
MLHTHKGEMLHFTISYKNRTSIGIYLDSYGQVEVKAPKGADEGALLRFLEEHWETILHKSKEKKERLNGPEQKTYDHGETFLYLGQSFPINITQDSNAGQDSVTFTENALYIVVKEFEDARIQQALKRFYYKKCKALVEESISIHQAHFKKKPRSIKISDSRTTWGTCDGRRQLTFNWKLAMAPQEVIDYVVVHEMCHMVHLNHDRSFWRLVGKIMPDYKEKEQWLSYTSWKMTV